MEFLNSSLVPRGMPATEMASHAQSRLSLCYDVFPAGNWGSLYAHQCTYSGNLNAVALPFILGSSRAQISA
jgi:hypothetical protein